MTLIHQRFRYNLIDQVLMLKPLSARGFCNMIPALSKKVPKQIPTTSQSFLSSLLHRSKSSPSYPLLQELFAYLQTTPLFKQSFPFLSNSPHLQTNLMLAHCTLLSTRITQSFPKEQANYSHNLKAYFFEPYAKFIEQKSSAVDTIDYHFVDAYQKKYEALSTEVALAQANYVDGPQLLRNYQICFAQVVYEGKVRQGFPELLSLAKYYLAHVRYLGGLSQHDLLNYKVYWGLQEKPQLIDQLARDAN